MILTLYDIMGIQKFIFSTNKLKENIGASLIVSSMFKESPLNSIQDNDGYININDSELEGNDNTFRNDLSRYDIVNIYIAGGNALILYKNEDIMKSVNADLSEKFLRETGGSLSFAVAFTELNEKSFTDIFKELQIGIEKNKREFIRTKPLLGIGITKEELSTGLPVQIKTHEFGKDEYLSYQSYLKREYSKNDEFEKKYLGEDHKKFFCFPKKLDKLGQKSGEDYIAIVHIDGNDFGTIRNEIIQNQSDIETALRVMNELSDIITKIFESTMRNTIDDLIYHINRGNLDTVIERYENLPIKPLPIRPIILNGDDITFVCNGKLGLGLAECFLQNLYHHQEENNYEIKGKEINFTASGGVLIINSKFPFYRAYKFTEELCRSAKIKGKIIELSDNDQKGFWLDFHICNSDINVNLEKTRKNMYNIRGLPDTNPIECQIEGRNDTIRKEQYHLLWRPWNIIEETLSNAEHNWSDLKKVLTEFRNWPKNKVNEFLHALLTSKEKIELFQSDIEKRKGEKEIAIPDFLNSNDIFRERNNTAISPYFDALELLNYYREIKRRDDL